MPKPKTSPPTSDFECDTCGLKSDDLAIVADLRATIAKQAEEIERLRKLIVGYGGWFKALGGHRDHLNNEQPCEPCRLVAESDSIHAHRAALKPEPESR